MNAETPATGDQRPIRPAAIWACVALASALTLVPGDPEPRRPPEPRPEAGSGPRAGLEAGSGSESAMVAVGVHRLVGRVLDTSGAGVAAARVWAEREGGGGSREALTDAEGHFAIEEIPAGRWLVRAAAAGHSRTASTLDVPGGAVELQIAAVGRIAGQVLGIDGSPAAADVVLAGSGVWPARSVRTDAEGRFALEAVPPGIYEVQARSAQAAAEPRRGLVIEAGGRAFLTFHLERGESLLARVIDAETERPIAGAELIVMEDSLGLAPRVLRSGADGTARLGGLRGSSHRVTVHAEGYVPLVAEPWTPGAPLQVALEPGAVLRGIVLDARDRPIEGASLEIIGDATDRQPISLDGASVAFREHVFATHAAAMMPASLGALEVTSEVPAIPLDRQQPELAGLLPDHDPAIAPLPTPAGYVTGADGTFRITGVPPGHVQVLARAEGCAIGSSERVWVAPAGERDGVRIVLEPAARIEGLVRDAEGEPIADVVIEHRSDGDPWPRTTITDTAGAFVLEGVAGAVTVRAMPPERAAVQVRLDVAPGAREAITIELPRPGPTIAGRTLDESGHAIARAQVRLESMAPGSLPPRIVFSDEDGAFAIDDAPPGPWRLSLDHPDYAQGVPIDLDEPGTDLRLVAHEGVLVRGSVLDRMLGEGIAGAEITLESASVPPIVRTARTDEAGAFSIPRTQPGEYHATIVSLGRTPWSGALEIVANPRGEQELDVIELRSGATLEGEVVDALGRVLRGVAVGVEDAPSISARTDARGRFVLGGLAPGSHAIVASHPAVGEESRPIRISPARDPAPIVIRLPGRYDPDRAENDRALIHGVAARLEAREEAIVIASLEGARAERSGLRAGDVLRAIDGEEIADLETGERLLRGADGIDAVLDLERDGEPFRLRVAREAW